LQDYLERRRQERGMLLMTHIVLGYPSFEDSLRIAAAMVEAGVDLMELQVPFSEPIADGPVILRANQQALLHGSSVGRCVETATELVRRHPIPFVLMSYYNVLYRGGVDGFVQRVANAGLRGAIVPDLPPEEASDYLAAMAKRELDPIFIYSPNTSDARMARIAEDARGFVYCVARKGLTGSETQLSPELVRYLSRCRAATQLPLAVGFGVKSKTDVDFLRGKADIAVVGTESIRVIEQHGIGAIGDFIRTLRPEASPLLVSLMSDDLDS
jgi:tryptophan synthase alpha chain